MLRSCALNKRKTQVIANTFKSLRMFSSRLASAEAENALAAPSVSAATYKPAEPKKHRLLSLFGWQRANPLSLRTLLPTSLPHIFEERKAPKGNPSSHLV